MKKRTGKNATENLYAALKGRSFIEHTLDLAAVRKPDDSGFFVPPTVLASILQSTHASGFASLAFSMG